MSEQIEAVLVPCEGCQERQVLAAPEADLRTQPASLNGWGAPCSRCGHPATYHGMTFCQVDAGSSRKRPCDCSGYQAGEQCG